MLSVSFRLNIDGFLLTNPYYVFRVPQEEHKLKDKILLPFEHIKRGNTVENVHRARSRWQRKLGLFSVIFTLISLTSSLLTKKNCWVKKYFNNLTYPNSDTSIAIIDRKTKWDHVLYFKIKFHTTSIFDLFFRAVFFPYFYLAFFRIVPLLWKHPKEMILKKSLNRSSLGCNYEQRYLVIATLVTFTTKNRVARLLPLELVNRRHYKCRWQLKIIEASGYKMQWERIGIGSVTRWRCVCYLIWTGRENCYLKLWLNRCTRVSFRRGRLLVSVRCIERCLRVFYLAPG